MSTVGYRVFLNISRPDKALLAEYVHCRFGAMQAAIKTITEPGVKLIGVAVTVKARI